MMDRTRIVGIKNSIHRDDALKLLPALREIMVKGGRMVARAGKKCMTGVVMP